jgi:hypothetical protein
MDGLISLKSFLKIKKKYKHDRNTNFEEYAQSCSADFSDFNRNLFSDFLQKKQAKRGTFYSEFKSS